MWPGRADSMAKREGVKTNAELQGFLTRELKYPVSFGGQRSIQLSYGCVTGSFSRLAKPRQRPCGGWLGEEQGPEGKGHTFESCRVRRKACAERAGTVAGTLRAEAVSAFIRQFERAPLIE